MIALLRCARLFVGQGAASIRVELRRHHDTKSVGGCDNRMFSVMKRPMFMPGQPGIQMVKNFTGSGAQAEARRYWIEEVARLETMGYRREEVAILGFHEED